MGFSFLTPFSFVMIRLALATAKHSDNTLSQLKTADEGQQVAWEGYSQTIVKPQTLMDGQPLVYGWLLASVWTLSRIKGWWGFSILAASVFFGTTTGAANCLNLQILASVDQMTV